MKTTHSAPSLCSRLRSATATPLILAALLLPTAQSAAAQSRHTRQDVLALATRANDYFLAKWSDPTEPTKAKKIRPNNLWTRAVWFEGLMALNEVQPEERYIRYVDAWGSYHKWMPYSGNLNTVDADHQCCAQTYIMRYRMTGGEDKITPMRTCFDNQIATRSNRHWTWIDAIQMAMPALAMMSTATGDSKYIDYAMRSYLWSRDSCGQQGLFNQQQGLWWRDANFLPPYKESDGRNCYWSRGNGWVYAALCRVMSQLPPRHPHYRALLRDYHAMTRALLSCQRPDGYWNASLLSQDFAGPELTGTALFLYGLSWGLQRGHLKKRDTLPAAQSAWTALAACVHRDGFLGYVQGSGDRPASNQPVTYEKEPDFDDYGLGCFLLAAAEYSRVCEK